MNGMRGIIKKSDLSAYFGIIPEFCVANLLCWKCGFVVLLGISKSCKRTDFKKNPRIRMRIRILDESIINMCLQTCGLVSVHQTAANGVKQ